MKLFFLINLKSKTINDTVRQEQHKKELHPAITDKIDSEPTLISLLLSHKVLLHVCITTSASYYNAFTAELSTIQHFFCWEAEVVIRNVRGFVNET